MDTSNSNSVNIGMSLYYSKPESWEKNIPLHPYHLKLTEALSAGGRGELTVFCEQSVSAETLTQLNGCKAEVQIHHRCESNSQGRNVERYFSGFITAVKHCGIYFSSSSTKIYKFILLIESPDVMLNYRLQSAQYTQTAVDLVKTLYEQNSLDRADVVAAPNLSSDFKLNNVKFIFDQRAEKDYDFLRRSLAALGLSYVFQYVPPQNNLPVLPKLLLCCGSNYPTEGDSNEKETTFSCRSFPSAFRMDSWSMISRQGVKGVRINYQSSNSKATNSFAGEENDAKLYDLHDFPFALAEDQTPPEDGNIFAKNYLNSFNMDDSDWIGVCMIVDGTQPGNKILLRHFYGDDTNIEARVVSSEVDCYCSVDIGIQNDDLKKPEVSVTIHCRSIKQAITTPAPKILAASPAKASENTSNCEVGVAVGGNSEPETGVQSNVSIIQAIVCKFNESTLKANIGNSQSGKTESCATFLSSGGRETYIFKAYIGSNSVEKDDFRVAQNEIIDVRLVMPLGGRGEGLFHVPRIGDRILVFRNGNENYLAGYLPNSENFKFLNSNQSQIKTEKESVKSSSYPVGDMTVLRQSSTTDSLAYLNNGTYQTLNHPKGRRKTAGSDTKKRQIDHPFSEIGIYGPLRDGETVLKDGLVNLASSYDLNVSARKEVYIEGRNVEISCPGYDDTYNNSGNRADGIVKIQEVGDVMVEAKHGIMLKSGNSIISITPNGIVIQSGPGTSISGPVGATIALDPFIGVSVSASKFLAIGNLGIDLIAPPSSVSIGSGGVSLSGPAVNSSTVPTPIAAMTFGITVQGMLKQAISCCYDIRSDAGKTWDTIWDRIGLFSDTIVHQIQVLAQEIKKEKGQKDGGAIVGVIFAFVIIIGQIVIAAIKASNTQEWLNKTSSQGSSLTRAQALSLSSFVFTLTQWLVIFATCQKKNASWTNSCIALQGQNMYLESGKYCLVGTQVVNAQSGLKVLNFEDAEFASVAILGIIAGGDLAFAGLGKEKPASQEDEDKL